METNDQVSIITNLHDSVLSHILSCLPTKDAVRTSILSKDWKFKWTLSHNVDIEFIDFPSNSAASAASFTNLVGRILDNSPNITHFRFIVSCKILDTSYLQTWISAVLRHSLLECFDVDIGARVIVYPCSLLNKPSLRKLIIRNWQGTLNITPKNFAPNLTTLLLSGVQIVNGDPNNGTVTFTFPVLEMLTMRHCVWLNVKCLEIHAPCLNAFYSAPQIDMEYDYSIVLVAPKLTMFKCSSTLPENFIFNGSPAVISAFLHSKCSSENQQLRREIGLLVQTLINHFINLEELELTDSMAALSQLGPPLCPHHKLRRLTLLGAINAEQLFGLLRAAPSLKFLSMKALNGGDYDYGAAESVPSCVTFHLEEVIFNGFSCDAPNYKLVEFLLGNAEQLKELTINEYTSVERENPAQVVIEHLSTFPRRSPCAALLVSKIFLPGVAMRSKPSFFL